MRSVLVLLLLFVAACKESGEEFERELTGFEAVAWDSCVRSVFFGIPPELAPDLVESDDNSITFSWDPRVGRGPMWCKTDARGEKVLEAENPEMVFEN